MANVYCTKKLEKVIGKQNISKEETESLLGNWNANLFYVNRKKCIFLISDKTCYSVIIPNFLKKDLKGFEQKFYQRLLDQFQFDQIEIDQRVKDVLTETRMNFLKTNNNRKIIGTMTQFIKDLEYFLYYHDQRLTLPELNNKVTNNYVSVFGKKKNDFNSPIELMEELLKKAKDKVYA